MKKMKYLVYECVQTLDGERWRILVSACSDVRDAIKISNALNSHEGKKGHYWEIVKLADCILNDFWED